MSSPDFYRVNTDTREAPPRAAIHLQHRPCRHRASPNEKRRDREPTAGPETAAAPGERLFPQPAGGRRQPPEARGGESTAREPHGGAGQSTEPPGPFNPLRAARRARRPPARSPPGRAHLTSGEAAPGSLPLPASRAARPRPPMGCKGRAPSRHSASRTLSGSTPGRRTGRANGGGACWLPGCPCC